MDTQTYREVQIKSLIDTAGRHTNSQTDRQFRNYCVDLPVKNNVDRTDKNFPGAIQGEKVSKKIKVFSLQCLGPFIAFAHILQVINF